MGKALTDKACIFKTVTALKTNIIYGNHTFSFLNSKKKYSLRPSVPPLLECFDIKEHRYQGICEFVKTPNWDLIQV